MPKPSSCDNLKDIEFLNGFIFTITKQLFSEVFMDTDFLTDGFGGAAIDSPAIRYFEIQTPVLCVSKSTPKKERDRLASLLQSYTDKTEERYRYQTEKSCLESFKRDELKNTLEHLEVKNFITTCFTKELSAFNLFNKFLQNPSDFKQDKMFLPMYYPLFMPEATQPALISHCHRHTALLLKDMGKIGAFTGKPETTAEVLRNTLKIIKKHPSLLRNEKGGSTLLADRLNQELAALGRFNGSIYERIKNFWKIDMLYTNQPLAQSFHSLCREYLHDSRNAKDIAGQSELLQRAGIKVDMRPLRKKIADFINGETHSYTYER